jgi:hypothetical protein
VVRTGHDAGPQNRMANLQHQLALNTSALVENFQALVKAAKFVDESDDTSVAPVRKTLLVPFLKRVYEKHGKNGHVEHIMTAAYLDQPAGEEHFRCYDRGPGGEDAVGGTGAATADCTSEKERSVEQFRGQKQCGGGKHARLQGTDLSALNGVLRQHRIKGQGERKRIILTRPSVALCTCVEQ